MTRYCCFISPSLWLYIYLTSANLSHTLTNLLSPKTLITLDCGWQMGVDVANSGMVQLVSLQTSWLAFIYFVLGLWPSCSHSHLAPWAYHVTWTFVCSSAAKVLSCLFLCVCQRCVVTERCLYVVDINVWTYFPIFFPTKVLSPNSYRNPPFRIYPKLRNTALSSAKMNRSLCTRFIIKDKTIAYW